MKLEEFEALVAKATPESGWIASKYSWIIPERRDDVMEALISALGVRLMINDGQFRFDIVETDVNGLSDADLKLLDAAREMVPKLIKVAKAAKAIELGLDRGDAFTDELKAMLAANAELEQP